MDIAIHKGGWEAIAWTRHSKTSVVINDESSMSGLRVIAECESEDVADLVAAAPEVLNALQDMLHVMEQHEQLSGCDCSIGDQARAAIAKATGKES